MKMLLSIDHRSRTIKYVNFLGDFFATPQRIIYDLECRLKSSDFSIQKLEITITDFFKKYKGSIIGFTARDFIDLLSRVEDKMSLHNADFSIEDSNNLFVVNSSYRNIFSKKIKTILLPYCAKGSRCKYRRKQTCNSCGSCTTGDAYTLAQDYGYKPVTITSFRHLMMNLRRMKHENGFIGLCCENFFVRHKKDMEKHGLPGLLINIENQTCYDLDQAREARSGNFEHQTNLRIPLLGKILETYKNGF
jgi:lipoate-protein ligase A